MRFAFVFLALIALVGCSGAPAPARTGSVTAPTVSDTPASQPVNEPQPKVETPPQPKVETPPAQPKVETAPSQTKPGEANLAFRRGETPLPLTRSYTAKNGAVLAVEVKQAEGGLALLAKVNGETIYETRDGVEKIEEAYLGQMVDAGSGEIVITTRRDCKFLRLRIFAREEGAWKMAMDRADMAGGILRPAPSHLVVSVPSGGGYELKLFQYGSQALGANGIRTWVPGWNDHYSMWSSAADVRLLPPIPDCP